jgi:hypothetical protein
MKRKAATYTPPPRRTRSLAMPLIERPWYRRKAFLNVSIISLVLSVVGLLLWLPFYLPNVDIDIPTTSNPESPQPAVFTVSNKGPLTVYELKADIFIFSLSIGPAKFHSESIGIGMIATALSPGQSQDFVYKFATLFSRAPVTNADLETIVSFRPKFSWQRSFTCARYQVDSDADRNLRWLRKEPRACEAILKCAALHRSIGDPQHPHC